MDSFKSQSLPSAENKVPDLPSYFDRNIKSQEKNKQTNQTKKEKSRGQAQCKLKKASVFSLDCTFHSFCLTAQYKLLS